MDPVRRGAVVIVGILAAAAAASAAVPSECPSSEQLQLELVSVKQGGQPVAPSSYTHAPQGAWLWADPEGQDGRVVLSGVGPSGSYEERFVARP